MIEITLYSKEGCHLCEIVKNDLASLKKTYPHLNFRLHEIDITQDKELFKKYCLAIPVLEIGTQILEAPIEKHQLIDTLNL